MDLCLPYLLALGGGALGLGVCLYPALRTVGWVCTYALGPAPLVSYWITTTVINVLQQTLTGGLDEYGLCTAPSANDPNSSTEPNLVQPDSIEHWLLLVLGALVIGAAAGLGLCALGFRGFGGATTWALVVLIYLGLYGVDLYMFGLMAGVILMVQGLGLVGITNGPVICITLVSALAVQNPTCPEVQSTWTNQDDGFSLPAIGAGVLAGILPGLNAEVLCPADKPELGWLASVVAECVSLTVLLVQRNTSKTVLTTYLSSLNADRLDLTTLIIVITSTVLVLYSCPGLVKRVLIQQHLSSKAQGVLTIGALAGWINIPAAPLISLLMAAGLYYGSQYCIQRGPDLLPSTAARSIAMAPLLIWS